MIVTDVNALKVKSEPVTNVGDARNTVSLLLAEIKKHDTAIGLSAIQIGYPEQVSVITTKAGTFILINPKIVELSNKFTFVGEGCLSFPEQYCNTERYYDVVIDNHVIEDNNFRIERQYFHTDDPQKDITAIAVQHEIDHHNGIVFHDRKIECVPIKSNDKIGRNEPCPCKSGKKYKKCCGAKE